MNTDFPELLTVAQLAEFFGVSRSAAYRLARRLRSYRVPGVGLRFRRSDAEAFLEAHGRGPLEAVTVTAPPARCLGMPVVHQPNDLNAEVAPGMTRGELRDLARKASGGR